MNAFESIVARFLESEGYWVRQSVKVDITKEDKRKIGLPTMPRPEIDLVALDVKGNELLLIEVKSFLDSYGVYFEAVTDANDHMAARYRLFTDKVFRKIVSERIFQSYFDQGLIKKTTKINYALAAGNIHSDVDEQKIRKYFARQDPQWKIFSPTTIKDRIREWSDKGYEDDLVTITAKLVMRD